jgi:hypothetical protein
MFIFKFTFHLLRLFGATFKLCFYNFHRKYKVHIFSHMTIDITNNYFDPIQLSTSFPVLPSEGWKWSVFEICAVLQHSLIKLQNWKSRPNNITSLQDYKITEECYCLLGYDAVEFGRYVLRRSLRHRRP